MNFQPQVQNQSLSQSQPANQAEIATAIDGIDGAINRLDNTVSMLRNRLEPVIRPSAPATSAGSNQVRVSPGIVSPITGALDSRRDSIDGLAEALNELMSRLAV